MRTRGHDYKMTTRDLHLLDPQGKIIPAAHKPPKPCRLPRDAGGKPWDAEAKGGEHA